MRVGVGIIITLIIFIVIIQRLPIILNLSFLYISIFILLFILFISIYSYLCVSGFDILRFYLSFILLILFLISAFIFSTYILKLSNFSFKKAFNFLFYIVLFDGLLSTLIYLINRNEKSLLIFKEPSHFALVFLPLLLSKILIDKQNNHQNIFIVLSFFIAFGLENLTLLIGLLIILLILLNGKNIILFFILFTIIFILNIENFAYFTSRIDLSQDNTNLSTLVFLSGWERAYLNVINTNGIGIGFQQLGTIGQNGYYQDVLAQLGMGGLNLNDGGSTASKLISELGVFGLIILFVYLIYFVKYFFDLKKNIQNNSKYIFFKSIFVMFFVELFIRGTGYFTPTSFMLVVAISYFLTIDKSRVVHK